MNSLGREWPWCECFKQPRGVIAGDCNYHPYWQTPQEKVLNIQVFLCLKLWKTITQGGLRIFLLSSWINQEQGFPGSSNGKRVFLQCGRLGFDPRVGKIPWRRKWQPTPVFLPGKSHGQRSLVVSKSWT